MSSQPDMRPAEAFDAAAAGPIPDLAVPGMLTGEEEALYFDTARRSYMPGRKYLEVGTWLGRSTHRICQGLEAAAGPEGDWALACFDQFVWMDQHRKKVDELGPPPAPVADLRHGDSFQGAFETMLGGYAPRVRAYSGRLDSISLVMEDAFQPADRLGAVFVDASKGWPSNARMLRFIAPHLVHDEAPTKLLFQDFFMLVAYKLIFLLQLLPQLQPVTYSGAGSLLFELRAPIDPDDPVLQEESYTHVTRDQVYAAWERYCALLPEARRRKSLLPLCLPMMLWFRHCQDDAMREAAKIELTDHERTVLRMRVNRNPGEFDIPPLTQLLD